MTENAHSGTGPQGEGWSAPEPSPSYEHRPFRPGVPPSSYAPDQPPFPPVPQRLEGTLPPVGEGGRWSAAPPPRRTMEAPYPPDPPEEPLPSPARHERFASREQLFHRPVCLSIDQHKPGSSPTFSDNPEAWKEIHNAPVAEIHTLVGMAPNFFEATKAISTAIEAAHDSKDTDEISKFVGIERAASAINHLRPNGAVIIYNDDEQTGTRTVLISYRSADFESSPPRVAPRRVKKALQNRQEKKTNITHVTLSMPLVPDGGPPSVDFEDYWAGVISSVTNIPPGQIAALHPETRPAKLTFGVAHAAAEAQARQSLGATAYRDHLFNNIARHIPKEEEEGEKPPDPLDRLFEPGPGTGTA